MVRETTTVASVIARRRERALAQGVSPGIVERAARATHGALGGASGDVCALRFRAQRYFDTVVRSEVVRSGRDRHAAARMVLDTVVNDLSATGRDSSAIWREIDRGWRDSVPVQVIEEFRERLSA